MNNSKYKTGCSAGTYSISTSTSTCKNGFGTLSVNEYIQSTTGNITGIFDMSGGLFEYALSYLPGGSEIFGGASDGNHAGFTEPIDSKYYDLFTTQSPETNTTRFNACNNGACYGYGLIETKGWFQSYANFYDAAETPFTVPWMELGGSSYASFMTAGVTAINFGSGVAHEYDGSRVIISK